MDDREKKAGRKPRLKPFIRIRTCIQIIVALILNANFKGFFTGEIYKGKTKNFCVAGLNCYSCPGAVGSCPIGALQNSLSAYKFKLPYYVMGLLIFFGVMLGRIVCAFLCPFGLLQDLLYMIPFFKKIRTFKGDRVLRWLKYVVLVVMVIVLPIMIKLTPVFCKYLCPSGTVSGILLVLSNSTLVSQLGKIFTWKVIVLAVIVVTSIIISRPFCKYLCPLGGIYGLFNRVAVLQMKVDEHKCTDCGLCRKSCIMDINPPEDIKSVECIRCGNCARECPSKAIGYCSVFSSVEKKEAE